MNLPNKITLIRMLLVPIMIVVIFLPYINSNEAELFWGITIGQLIFLILFIIGSFTDFLDGYLARKYNQVTTFGKFLDPIADKMLTITAFLYLIKLGYVQIWIVAIIILREFIVSGIRLVVAKKDVVIAASLWGKIKTTVTMVTIIFILFNEFNLGKYTYNDNEVLNSIFGNVGIISCVLLLVTTVLTVQSGLDYFLKSKNYIFESM
jgi:CDP-diacylglycerol--glycerol-3-phosphate 3-phosphatidyltransferase